MTALHCNNTNCEYNTELECTAGHVYYIERLCVTYRRKRKENYRELMRPDVGICERKHGVVKRRGR